MTQDRPSYKKDLAAILKKAQGRVDAESGEHIHVGDEVARLRDTLDQLSKAAKASEAAQQAEPVAWMTEIFEYDPPARCTHSRAESAQHYQEGAGGPERCRIVPLYTTPPAPAPVVPEGEYQYLNHGDIIQDSDEVEDESGNWLPVQRCIGEPAPDPKYTSHRWYRRHTSQPATVPEGYVPVPAEFITVLNAAPEINPSNYDHDQVCELNAAVNEALAMLSAAQEQPAEQEQYVYEIVDATDDEKYYPMGIYSTLEKARAEIVDGSGPMTEHAEEVCTNEVRRHKLDGVGWGTGTVALTVQWEENTDGDWFISKIVEGE